MVGSTTPAPCDLDEPQGLDRQFRDKNSPVWDMSQERMFIEGVCNQRFHFLLAFFLATVAAAGNAPNAFTQRAALVAGIIICLLLELKLFENFRRLEYVLEYIRKDKKHPETIITNVVEALNDRPAKVMMALKRFTDKYGRFALYQWVIPSVCISVLFLALIASLLGWTLKPN